MTTSIADMIIIIIFPFSGWVPKSPFVRPETGLGGRGHFRKRDPIIIWQSVVAFAPRESGAERWQYSLAIRFERAVHTEKGEVK